MMKKKEVLSFFCYILLAFCILFISHIIISVFVDVYIFFKFDVMKFNSLDFAEIFFKSAVGGLCLGIAAWIYCKYEEKIGKKKTTEVDFNKDE